MSPEHSRPAGPPPADPVHLDADGAPWRAPMRTPVGPAWSPPLVTRPGPVERARRLVAVVRPEPVSSGPAARAAAVAALLALPLLPVLLGDPDPPVAPAGEAVRVVRPPVAAVCGVAASSPPSSAPRARPVAPPSGLVVPAIGLRAGSPEQLTIGPDGALGAPADFDRIGFWTGGPTPGQAGPAVIVGHVDSFRGPAVFWRLQEIPVGATVTVPRTDGRSTTFTVDRIEVYPKDRFPSDEVYGPTANAQLRLITCGGSFDRAARSYRENIVVFASVH
ncbi:hypothetical protein GCM10009772_27640 [Pseudonocardia alni subsp. carboxydivorans]|uniref:class F sortase n=1 Tax=Pseudonocardia alni TaxID=33907 RepID=UPI0031F9448C